MAGLLQQFLTALGVADAPATAELEVVERAPARSRGLSTTVFSGTAASWEQHLRVPWSERPDGWLALDVQVGGGGVAFEAAGPEGELWAEALTLGFARARQLLEQLPSVLAIYDRLVAGNAANTVLPLRLYSSSTLPTVASRETRLDDNVTAVETRILVNRSLLDSLQGPLHGGGLKAVWPVVQAVLLQLGQQIYPRDRFTERIDLTARWAAVVIHLLYKGRKGGRLEPRELGEAFESWVVAREGIPRGELFTRSPFFRMLGELSFLLNDRALPSLLEPAAVVVRDHLDTGYLRLSLAEIMPGIPASLAPMPYEWKSKKRLQTPKPEVGRYGIVDREDLDAWKQVDKPLLEIGYHVIGQLGMGQFGRVYEAVNLRPGSLPGRVAIKVDRFRKGRKKEAIEAAETIMETARGLSRSPHVIRVFDAGKLHKHRATYHVLQLVEGDTLDHLLGIAGEEHASILRPKTARHSPQHASTEFFKALSKSEGEAWRKLRKSHRFLGRPSLSHILDLLTSKALWVEEVHALGFAVNDLKNGNIMLNRRGQFKGIDLDSYSPVYTAIDKMPDFFFLAVSVLQMVAKAAIWDGGVRSGEIHSLLGDPRALERFLTDTWVFGDLAAASAGRVETGEVVAFLAGFIDDCRSGAFSNNPTRYSRAIDHLIAIKRRLSGREIILE